MTLLVQYDRARCALAEATRVDQVLAIRDELEHVKLYARQIRDRALMADAAAFQMRAERRLGVLLVAAREAGQLVDKGRRKTSDAEPVATLKEIGVDKKLSMTAQRAAALEETAFEALVDGVREKMASGRAIVVDPIDAAVKAAEIDRRRSEHAARTLDGGTADDLATLARSGFRAATLYMDPPWHFQTRSAAGEGRSANTHYTTGLIDRIMADLAPVQQIAADPAVLLMWMVDWGPHLALALIEALGFEHKTTAFTWAKTEGDGWHMGQGYWTRANPEDCWLATRGSPKRLHADVRQLIVATAPSRPKMPRRSRLVAITGSGQGLHQAAGQRTVVAIRDPRGTRRGERRYRRAARVCRGRGIPARRRDGYRGPVRIAACRFGRRVSRPAREREVRSRSSGSARRRLGLGGTGVEPASWRAVVEQRRSPLL